VKDSTYILVAVVAVFGIFFIARELICWYWKINLQISLLTEIRDLLKAQGSPPGNTSADGRREPTIGPR
jgi:hypothetical protein